VERKRGMAGGLGDVLFIVARRPAFRGGKEARWGPSDAGKKKTYMKGREP